MEINSILIVAQKSKEVKKPKKKCLKGLQKINSE